MKKIFLDIGAYDGQSTLAAREYGFDEIHMFEPSTVMHEKLRGIAAGWGNTFLHPFGLLDKACTKTLYHSGCTGGTIYRDKTFYDAYATPDTLEFEKCEFRDAKEWFIEKFSWATRSVWMKMNCEGAEIPILTRLLPKYIDHRDHLMIDFDACKIPSMAGKVLRVREKLRARNIDLFDITLTESSPADCMRAWMDPQR